MNSLYLWYVERKQVRGGARISTLDINMGNGGSFGTIFFNTQSFFLHLECILFSWGIEKARPCTRVEKLEAENWVVTELVTETNQQPLPLED